MPALEPGKEGCSAECRSQHSSGQNINEPDIKEPVPCGHAH